MEGSDRPNTPVEAWKSPDYEPTLPVSEKSNPLSRDIDRASANQIVRILQACDAQMFQKEECYQNPYQRLWSEKVLKSVMEVALRVQQILKDPEDSLVVLSGCGTSGRLAFLIATSFNKALKKLNQKPVYTYIIAGGDRALFTSQEAPEDDPELGMLCLKQVCEGKKKVLFIGISCGLSAPFVAGELDFCLQRLDVCTPVLIGFNPSHQARSDPMRGSTLTFHDVVQRMEAAAVDQKAFLLNPAVGPEAISGSSRMKGGSATKMFLELIMCAAHEAAFAHRPISLRYIEEHMEAYAKTLDVTYAQSEGIAAIMESAAQSLQSGSRVCCLGWGRLGVLGMIDASECRPTFGADYNDVRGFVGGGYSELENKEGSLSSLGSNYCISHEDFLQMFLPSISDQDTVLLIYSSCDNLNEVTKMAAQVQQKTSKLHAVFHQVEGDGASERVQIDRFCLTSLRVTWPSTGSKSVQSLQWELSTKLVLNAVSTGAHVLKGKIYQNYMIDLQVTNSKLYRRAANLLQKLTGFPKQQCEEALLKAVYRVDEVTADVALSDICAHARAAARRSKVVPLALVCLLTGCSLAEAESNLGNQPIIRDAVVACLSKLNMNS